MLESFLNIGGLLVLSAAAAIYSHALARGGWPSAWQLRLILSVFAVAIAVALFSTSALAAGEQIGTAIDRVTAWIRGILIAVGILTFVIGADLFMIQGTGAGAGGGEKGKGLMVAAVVGVLLGFLAGPIVDLAASFVR